MAELRIRNKQQTVDSIDHLIRRMNDTRVGLYRQIIRDIFRRILVSTPQFSGHLVAHWDIGLDAPSSFQDPDLGRRDLKLARTHAGEIKPLQRGSRYWINIAWQRNLPKFEQIRRGTRVYISNNALGDTDGGSSSPFYIDTLQDPAYWASKLRAVNRPYETVQESIQHVVAKYRRGRVNAVKWKPEPVQRVL